MRKVQRQLTQKEKRSQIRERLLLAPELSNRTIAKTIGVSHITVGSIRKKLENSGQINHMTTTLNTDWLTHPLITQNIIKIENLNKRNLRAIRRHGVLDLMQKQNLTSPLYAQRLLSLQEKEKLKDTTGINIDETYCQILQADIRNGLPEIANDSVDAIITDMPYGLKYVNLVDSLASVAARVLRPDGGRLIIMTGQIALPTVMRLLAKHPELKYIWVLAYLTPAGGSPIVHGIGVTPNYKTILLYAKGKYNFGIFSDIIHAGAPDKTREKLIDWEQDVTGFEIIVDRFTNPGETILDPMCGSGTTGVAALHKRRKAILADISAECVRITQERIAAVLAEQRE
jgi:ubiquinone/menaquinone biosynthesis C-methylase UbiE